MSMMLAVAAGLILAAGVLWHVSRLPRGLRRIGSPLLAILAFVVAGLALLHRGAGAGFGNAGGGHRASPARLAEIDSSFRALEDAERTSPRDRWDPDYVVSMVGRDPQRLFAWVRDNTHWIPYRGVLRGPVGVLMDRLGNSLDRALLLATLLDKAGHTVRLAHGTLTEEQALALLPGLVASLDVAPPLSHTLGVRPHLQEVAARYHLDGVAIAKRLEALNTASSRVTSELDARVADQTDRLLRAVEVPDPRIDWNKRLQRAVEALRDHWWVQLRGDQGWSDLDLLRAGVSSTELLVAVKDTVRLQDVAGDSLYQEISVRVITEQWSKGTLTERKALEHVLRPADLIGESIVLQFWPMDWMPDSAGRSGPQGDLKGAVVDQHIWVATLLVGREAVATTALLDDGQDFEKPVKGGAMSALGSGLSHTLEGTTRSELSAVWLEYEVRIPGESPRRTRRTVFDLIGPAGRAASTAPALRVDESKRLTRGLALAMRTEILPVVCELSPQFIRHLLAEGMLGNRELIQAVVRGRVVPWSAVTDSLLDRSSPTLTPLYSLAAARLKWSREAGHIYIDQPGILTRHLYAARTSDGIALRDATDIVANDVGVSLAVPDAFRVRLAQGVFDTNAEALLRLSADVFGNTGDAFAASRNWVTLASVGGSALDRVTASEDMRRQLRDQLAAGFVVVAPDATGAAQTKPFAGWWRIDPATGQTLGYGDNGWGQGGEDAALNARARLAAPLYKRALTLFAAGFIPTFFWCLPAVTDREIETGGWRHAFTSGTLVSTAEECTGDAIVMGAMTMTFFLTLEFAWPEEAGAISAAPDEPNPPKDNPKPPKDNPNPPKDNPNPPKDNSNPPKDNPKPPKDNPYPPKDNPDNSKTQRDAKCAPQLEWPPPNPAPEGYASAKLNYENAVRAEQATYREMTSATGEWIRYELNNPESFYPGKDVSKWDPKVEKQLRDRLEPTRRAWKDAVNWEEAAQKEFKAAEAQGKCVVGSGDIGLDNTIVAGGALGKP